MVFDFIKNLFMGCDWALKGQVHNNVFLDKCAKTAKTNIKTYSKSELDFWIYVYLYWRIIFINDKPTSTIWKDSVLALSNIYKNLNCNKIIWVVVFHCIFFINKCKISWWNHVIFTNFKVHRAVNTRTKISNLFLFSSTCYIHFYSNCLLNQKIK